MAERERENEGEKKTKRKEEEEREGERGEESRMQRENTGEKIITYMKFGHASARPLTMMFI